MVQPQPGPDGMDLGVWIFVPKMGHVFFAQRKVHDSHEKCQNVGLIPQFQTGMQC
jgi:hypothetical protein